MIETVTRKRIEILTDVALVKRVTEAVDAAGITGWTVTPVTSRSGSFTAPREKTSDSACRISSPTFS